MTPEQQQEITNLRALNLTPKQIARKLGLKVSEVSAVIKGQAEQVALARAAAGELDPVVECLTNISCVQHFLLGKTADPLRDDSSLEKDEFMNGIAMVSVTRQTAHNRLSVCTYLVDMWCLGVKDCLGPRKLDRTDYNQLMAAVFQGFPEGYQKITLEQAQALVFSAVDYAAELGFKPHHDFEKTRSHLGEWNGENRIQCGRDGKPFYISGPYDNPKKVMDTLHKSVGEGNYDFLVGME